MAFLPFLLLYLFFGYGEFAKAETTECVEDQIVCDSGMCIMGRYVCDGIRDCPDGDDEDNCSSDATTPTAPVPVSPATAPVPVSPATAPVPVSPVTGICADTSPGRALGDRMYSISVENLGQCCEECMGTYVCVAWTFYLSSGECILRSTFEKFLDSEGWESGLSTPPPSSSLTVGTSEVEECEIMTDVRISGERVKSKGKETWQDCCDFCMDEADCIAWAFHEDRAIEEGNGDCVLRSGDLSSQHNAGWVSGEFTDLWILNFYGA